MTQTQSLAVPPQVKPLGFPGIPEGWVAEAETFLSPGTTRDPQLQLFAVHYRDANASSGPNAHRVLIVVHGMGEHGGRYQHFPHYLKERVGHIYTVDHRGHGRSEGIRGHVVEFDTLVQDLAHSVLRIQERVQKSNPSKKVELHLFGHSLGGLLALRLLFLHPEIQFASSTASAPALGIKAKVPVIKRLAAEILAHVWGSLQIPTDLDVTTISRDPEVQKAYTSDRLVHSKMTPKFYKEFTESMKNTLKREAGIHGPLLVILPMQDGLIDSETALGFFRALKHRDKRLKTFPDFRHESFNEIGKEQAFGELAQWIQENSK